MSKYFYILVLFFLFIHCDDKGKKVSTSNTKTKKASALFTLLSPQETKLNFINLINETPTLNGFIYEYLYNGGGVAVGDLNNDNLPDLYFISNMHSNKLFINKGDLVFKETTLISKVKGNKGFPTGVTMVDINADGLLDIYVCKSGEYSDLELRKNELYINTGINKEGIPVFMEKAAKYGLDLPHYSTQSAFFDYDRDGDLDMFLINHGIGPSEVQSNLKELLNKKSKYSSERLYQNDNGKFKDVSETSGIIDNSIGFGLGIAIGDLNNDNWPDIIVGHDYSESDHIYINQQNGSFSEVVKESTNHISNFSMGNDVGDINNDGWFDFISLDMISDNNYDLKTSMSGMNPKRFQELVDLGLHHQYMSNTLQLNNGNAIEGNIPAFSEIGKFAGVSTTNWSWAPLLFDMDNDGWQDMFVSNGIVRSFGNNDFLIYKEKKLADLHKNLEFTQNKDSLIKIYYDDLLSRMPKKAEVNQLFLNNKNLTFSSKHLEWDLTKATCATGAIYSDLDNDGDLDIVTNNINDMASVYKNNSNEVASHRKYLKIKFKGSSENTNGLGAKVILESNSIKQTKQLYVSRGFQSSVDNILHFGLDTAEVIKKLTIIWPDGKSQIITDLEVNNQITLSYEESLETNSLIKEEKALFQDVSDKTKLNFKHKENKFDDFERESLLPHKLSQNGPALSCGDINNDGLDDFYVGGAKNQSASLFIQQDNGNFKPILKSLWEKDRKHEDIASKFFDADNDGDLDLYVVSGGNEEKENDIYYQDRLYENLGKGIFQKTAGLIPDIRVSGACIETIDIDGDNDLDLFIGGKLIPGKYPLPANSYLLRNNSSEEGIKFIDDTEKIAPFLKKLGLVTDAKSLDLDNDNDFDLIVVGEWMQIKVFKNTENGFIDATEDSGLGSQSGWWFGLATADFDMDGDQDFIVGNLGLNYKYNASPAEPFEVFANDFDQNGTLDIVLGYHDNGVIFPLRGRECSSNQMPFIKQKFPSYHDFGIADLPTVYGGKELEKALHYSATTFATTYVENLGNFQFKPKAIDGIVQFSSVNSILVDDFNTDGYPDALLSGNLYQSEVETPRNDASYGVLLTGNGKGKFTSLLPNESGLFIKGEVKNGSILNTNIENKKVIVLGKNNKKLQFIEYFNN
ncbi:MAG: VCBS repeat-containing protein [Flammeovirgaceae bacterium]|nr:VCBS repeat-containing protein [Flammeovirgaceae bacterium]